MTLKSTLRRIGQHERLNFLLTNGIPRTFVTRLAGRISQIEHPLVSRPALALWKLFADLELDDSAKTEFKSLQDCFTRELKPGARWVDGRSDVIVSPCDGIIGGAGRVRGDELIQAKGITYTLTELVKNPELAALYHDGTYVTLRLTSSMYHRFHAPADLEVEHVTYVTGDTWNTNPSTVARVDKLYCKNERAIVRTRLARTQHTLTLVPVAAILVASIRFHFIDVLLHLRYRGPNEISCRAPFVKGQEMGWFQHGSTIIVLAPRGLELLPQLERGTIVRMGQPLLQIA